MNLSGARYALRDLLAVKTGVQVVANPPRQLVAPVTIFFGARTGNRETQGGGEMVTIPVFVAVPELTDDQFDALDDFIDGDRSIIDIIDANPTPEEGVAFTVSGEWSEQEIEVGSTRHLAVAFTVQARF